MEDILNTHFRFNNYVGIYIQDDRAIVLTLHTMKYLLLNEFAIDILNEFKNCTTPSDINKADEYVPDNSFMLDDEVLNSDDILTCYLSQYHTNYKINDGVCNKLYAVELFDDIRFPENRIYEDIIVTCKLFSKIDKLIISSECLYNYKQRDNSNTNQQITFKTFDIVEGNLLRYNYIKSIYPEYEMYCRKLLINELLGMLYRVVSTNTIDIFTSEIINIVKVVKQCDIHSCNLTEFQKKLLILIINDWKKGLAMIKVSFNRRLIG
jgi:hypothetical protein